MLFFFLGSAQGFFGSELEEGLWVLGFSPVCAEREREKEER